MNISWQALHPEAQVPSQGRPGDNGYDLRVVHDIVLAPGERILADTGVAVALPDSYAGLVVPRSGLAINHGITVVNAPGLVDSNYRGAIGVILLNTDRHATWSAQAGERVAQLLVVRTEHVLFAAADELPESVRGDGAWGSSGNK